MLGMSIGDIISSVAIILSTLPLPKELPFEEPFFHGARLGNSQTCAAQGFSLFFGLGMTFGYTISLFLYNTCAIAFGMKEKKIVRYAEVVFHLLPLANALQLAIPPMVDQLYNPNMLYPLCFPSLPENADAEAIESFPKSKPVVVFYVMFITIVICIILIVWRVFKLEMILVRPQILLRSQSFGRAEQSLKNTRIIGISAFIYLLGFLFSAGAFALRLSPDGSYSDSNLKAYLAFTLVPLQGFFNFLIFISHKIYCYRRANRDVSRLYVLKKLFRGDAEEPLLFSRISVVRNDLDGRAMDVEVCDEQQSELLHLEYEGAISGSESGGQALIDDEQSQHESHNLDGFSFAAETKSNDESAIQNAEVGSISIDNSVRTGQDGTSSTVSPNSTDGQLLSDTTSKGDGVDIDISHGKP